MRGLLILIWLMFDFFFIGWYKVKVCNLEKVSDGLNLIFNMLWEIGRLEIS